MTFDAPNAGVHTTPACFRPTHGSREVGLNIPSARNLVLVVDVSLYTMRVCVKTTLFLNGDAGQAFLSTGASAVGSSY